MTNDKDRIQNAINHIRTSSDVDDWAVEIATDAMMKQIPKKPEISLVPRYGMGYEYYDRICPTCGHFLAFETQRDIPHHCVCGQAIDFGGEDK